MKLISIESSRVIFLIQLHRPGGQLYLPDALEKLAKRYSFIKAPSSEQAPPLTFAIGKFKNAQIAEFSMFNDGLIVSSASDTDLLKAFIDDLLAWGTKELGIERVATTSSETFYESSIIVKSDIDLAAALKPQIEISDLLNDAMKSAKIVVPLKLSGFILDFDPASFLGKRKPFRFIVDRRINVPFSDNIFFSQAPFRTKDHLHVLSMLEKAAKPATAVKRRRL
jgi:hypothetical protein